MGHVFPLDPHCDRDPVDVVAWWVEQAEGRGIVERAEEEESMSESLTAEELMIVRAAVRRGIDEHDIAYDLGVPIEAVEEVVGEGGR